MTSSKFGLGDPLTKPCRPDNAAFGVNDTSDEFQEQRHAEEKGGILAAEVGAGASKHLLADAPF
jgi:hypothetical protein